MKSKSLVVLAILAVIAVAGAMLGQHRGSGKEPGGSKLFPELLSKVNDVERIKATTSKGAFTLARKNDVWVVPEKHDFPADREKVRKLLLGAANLVRIDPKTSNPDLYKKLGLEDPGAQESKSLGFEVETGNGTIANFVLGTERPAKGEPEEAEYFVRLKDDPQSWLVQGQLPRGDGVVDWMDRDILSIPPERVRQLQIVHPDGTQVVVEKQSQLDKNFKLRDMPQGTEPKDEYKLNDMGKAFSELSLEDVKPVADVDFAGEDVFKIEMQTFDGLKVKAKGAKLSDDTFLQLEASFDESLVEKRENEEMPLLTPTEVQAQVNTLNSRWKPWAYQIPPYRVNYVTRRTAELVQPIDTSSGG